MYSDFKQSIKLPAYYDTDLENYWTQKSKTNILIMTYLVINLLILKENFENTNPNSNMSIEQQIYMNINDEYQKYQVKKEFR